VTKLRKFLELHAVLMQTAVAS